jgi:hypothetical protein
MRNRSKSKGLYPVLWGCALVIGACGGEDKPCPRLGTTTTGSTTPSTSGTGGEGAGPIGGGGSGAGQAGGGGSGGTAPADTACAGDWAFRAAGMSFTPPTPTDLATAFDALTFETAEHPVTVVLRASDPDAATVGAAPTMENDQYSNEFVPGFTPAFTDATVKQGSFLSQSPAKNGFLFVRHLAGVLQLALENVSVYAATSAGCGQATVTLDAVIPASERSKTLTTASGATTVGTLAGGDPDKGIQLRALFVAESITFDFSKL